MSLCTAILIPLTTPPALTDVRNLNLWGNDYSDISILRQLPNVEVLSLSVNSITTLKDLSNCLQLRELYLRKNRISELSEILYLVNLTHLKILWLSENPCCQTSNYREYVLSKLPNLQKLDNTDITKEEREIAMKRSSSAGSGGGGVGGNGGGMVQLRPASISDSDFASPRFSSPKGGEGGVQQFDFRSSNASLSPVSSPSRRAQSAHGYSRDDASRVPPLDFRQARSPVRKLDSQLALEGETPAELAARRRTDALEEEIRILRLAEDAERIRESARARMVASPVGRRQSTNRSTHSSPNSPRIRSAYGSPRHGAPVATPVVLSPRSSELSSAYVNGSQSSRIHPESNTVTQANTSNHVYGGPASAAASRPATARPAAGEKPNHIPPFARQLIPNNTNQQNGTPQRMVTRTHTHTHVYTCARTCSHNRTAST